MTTTHPVHCYLVTSGPAGDVNAREVPASAVALPSIGEIAVENQGDDAMSVWEAARDALAAVMPEPDEV